jgi:hypothetical protein
MRRMGQYRALQERTENESIFKTVSLLCSDFLFQLLHRTEQNRGEVASPGVRQKDLHRGQVCVADVLELGFTFTEPNSSTIATKQMWCNIRSI